MGEGVRAVMAGLSLLLAHHCCVVRPPPGRHFFVAGLVSDEMFPVTCFTTCL